jgi:flagellar motor switch protein FliM
MGSLNVDQNTNDSIVDPGDPVAKIVSVDFADRKPLTSEQMKMLVSLNQPFTRSASDALSGWLAANVSISMIAVERTLYQDHLRTMLDEDLYMVEGRFEGSGAAALLSMYQELVGAVVHLGLGGRADAPIPSTQRELSPIDDAIMQILLTTLWSELNKIWRSCGLKAIYEKRILKANAPKVFPQSEYLLSFTYEVHMGTAEGILQLSLSTTVADILLRELGRQDRHRIQPPETHRLLRQRFAQTRHTASLTLPPFRIMASDLLELQPGFVLHSGIARPTPARFCVPGGPVWNATPATRGSRLVAEISAPAHAPGHLTPSTLNQLKLDAPDASVE